MNERFLLSAECKSILPVNVVMMKLSLSCLYDVLVHILQFGGDGTLSATCSNIC
jgi:hypothetical protein